MKELKSMWKNCFNFTDRTSVRGYWMAILEYLVSSFLLTIIAIFIESFFSFEEIMFVPLVYAVISIIPLLSMQVRRLRDAGRMWTWLFITLVPCGGIVVFIFLCMPTNPSSEHLDTPQV